MKSFPEVGRGSNLMTTGRWGAGGFSSKKRCSQSACRQARQARKRVKGMLHPVVNLNQIKTVGRGVRTGESATIAAERTDGKRRVQRRGRKGEFYGRSRDQLAEEKKFWVAKKQGTSQ